MYASNAQITELGQVFDDVQDSMYQYLKVKSYQALMDYYQNEAKYRQELEKLNERNIDDSVKLLEKKIRKMSEAYLSCTAGTVAAKRGRNVEKYKQEYDKSLELYSYIQSSMDELNKQLFKENSQTYAALRAVMRYLEISNMVIMLLVVVCGMFLLITATREMFLPLTNMAETAQLVGQGNFNVKMPPADSRDELGTVTRAFNTMVDNLGLYIARTKASMEKEQQMIERELLMETHLKEAQLKYLQSQINPHFLYNTLDTIYMLARINGEETTMKMIQALSRYLRLSLSKGSDIVTVEDELENVKSYMEIQQIRNANLFRYEIECKVEEKSTWMLKLILQPLVENAIKHGFCEIYENGLIRIEIAREDSQLKIVVFNNGKPIDREMMKKINALNGHPILEAKKCFQDKEHGYGVVNVLTRLRLKYGEDVLFYYEAEENGTRCTIQIPDDGKEKRDL